MLRVLFKQLHYMSTKVKCAVIGVGNMGKNHARIYNELEQADLVAIADIDTISGKSIAKEYGAKFYDNFEDLLDNESIDVVSVCTPTINHYEVAKKCIKKHIAVLVEKPITANTKEGAELIQYAKDEKVLLCVGHIERHNPAVLVAKEIVEKKKLGNISSIIARRVGPVRPNNNDVGIAEDLAIHDIDIANFLLGSTPKNISVHKYKDEKTGEKDAVEFFLDYGPTSVYIQTNWITPVKIRKLMITGDKGYLELDYINQEVCIYHGAVVNSTEGQILDVQAKKINVPVKKQEPLKAELSFFINAFAEKKEVYPQYALDALEIALQN
jgi:UDP-N-acetylglucosamine 3-dehydrogenase